MKQFLKTKSKKAMTSALAGLMIAGLLSGCSDTGNNSQTTTNEVKNDSQAANTGANSESEDEDTTTASEDAFLITIMTRLGAAEAPTADNAVIKEIERITNTKLDIEWVPQAAYPEKLNVTVASNDYRMLTLFEGGGKPSTAEIEAVRAGIFWKVGDYLNDYDNLKQLDDMIVKNASIDGELWGMFRTRPAVRNGLYYRTDWAEELNLEPPKNPEELYAMLKAFVEDDPDGNGEDDTNGLAQESYLRLVFSMLSPYYGLGNGYDVVDGELTAVHTQDGYLEMLKFIKTLYDDGLMNRDFPTITETQRDEMMANNYGMAITSIDKGDASIVPLQKINPDANFTVMVALEDAKGAYLGRSGFDSKFYISNKVVTEESDVLRIMEYFNLMYGPEINNLVYNGIEGIHYDKTGDNTITISEEQSAKFLTEVNPMEQLAFRYTKNNYVVENQPPYTAQVQYFYDNYEGDVIGDPTLPLSSETFNEVGSQLEQQIWDAGVKFVTGAIDESGWLAEVDRWRQDGGDQMTAEYQAEYDAQQ